MLFVLLPLLVDHAAQGDQLQRQPALQNPEVVDLDDPCQAIGASGQLADRRRLSAHGRHELLDDSDEVGDFAFALGEWLWSFRWNSWQNDTHSRAIVSSTSGLAAVSSRW